MAEIRLNTFRLKLLALFQFAIQLSAMGQRSFSGIVRDSIGDPIPYASIHLVKRDSSTILLYATSDKNGEFKFLLNDSLEAFAGKFIYATYLKQRSKLIPVSRDQHHYELQIDVSGTLLSDVKVQSTIPALQKKADRFIFTPDRLLVEGSSALDVMKITPLIQYDEKSSLLSIINKEGTVIYINNRKSNMPKEMIISILRSTPGNNIKNIEIITNPGAEYGANITGGVININLTRMFDEGWSGYFTMSSEQSVYNTSVLNGSVNYRKNKIGIKISPFINRSFNYYTRDNLIQPVTGQQQNTATTMHRKYFVTGGGLGIDYDISKKDLLSYNGFLSTVNGSSLQSNFTQYYTGNNPFYDSVYSSPVNGKDRYIYNFGNIYYQHGFDSTGKRQLTFNIDYNQFYQKNTNDGTFFRRGDQFSRCK
jgi:iron complex outermembrane recepter protein